MSPTRSYAGRSRRARTLLLLAALAAGLPAAAAAGAQEPGAGPHPPARPSPLAPDTVLEPPGGPRIVLLASRDEGVAALRLAVPFREGRAEAGAGILLRDLALERMRALARPVGARVSATRTPWGLAYTASGPSADFEYLAYLLREAVAPPDREVTAAFREARARLAAAASEAVESPARRVAAELRGRTSGGILPQEGTPGSVAGLEPHRLRSFWMRTHQASAMTLVVSAPVAPEALLAAVGAPGAPASAAGPPEDAPVPSEPRRAAPQTLRTWYGEAWPIPGARAGEAAVAAVLVSRTLEARRAAGHEFSVELWELPDRWVLAVVGAAYAREAQAMRRTVSEVLAGTRATLEDGAVREATARLRQEALLAARTPWGLVSVVGRALDATGDPLAGVRSTAGLAQVDTNGMRGFFDELLRTAPLTVQLRP